MSETDGVRARPPLTVSVATVLIAAGLVGGIVHTWSANRTGAAGRSGGDRELHIGYQKGTALHLLRIRGDLDRRLAQQGIRVEWVDFPAGPQLLEAIAVGSVDLGYTGDTPAIFALAGGNDLAYVANQPPDKAGLTRGILVPHDSKITTIADLRGKKIAVQKGSGTHNVFIQLLERAGVRYDEIHPVYLAPPDARAAFESGAVDAWAIWDPFLAIAQHKTGARVLANGSGIVSAGGFYLSSKTFARHNTDLLRVALDEAEKTARWSAEHPREAAQALAPQLSLDVNVLEDVERRAHRAELPRVEVRPVGDEEMRAQQTVADLFLRIGLLPRRVDVRAGLLTPGEYSALIPDREQAAQR